MTKYRSDTSICKAEWLEPSAGNTKDRTYGHAHKGLGRGLPQS